MYDSTFEHSENVYGYVGGNPVTQFDPFGLDIWIAGPVGNQPRLHQTINIGNPNGQYVTYTYGVQYYPVIWGFVYQDLQGGPIQQYPQTTPAQDATALKELQDAIAADDQSYYGEKTCRTYSQDKFNQFAKEFNVSPSTPPVMPASSTPWWQQYNPMVLPSTSSSSSGSSTSR